VSAAQAGTWAPKVLNVHQLATVAAFGEQIIPETDTPGAKAALVDRFIDTVLIEANPTDRDRFLRGVGWVDGRSRRLFGVDFVTATPAQQADLLTRLAATNSRESRAGIDFFTAMKSMTITGYYTSEIGLRQELGDDGQLVLTEFTGCTHPDHQGPPSDNAPSEHTGHHERNVR
jgi:hypothetical protein